MLASECIPCPERSRLPRGYGQKWFRGQKTYAHRVAWILAHGEIPEGLFVLHHCDHPWCINPEHLFLGTDADNMADKIRKGRQAYGEDCYQAKLTWEAARAIRVAHAQGESQSALAIQYGVARQSITALIAGRTWKEPPSA